MPNDIKREIELEIAHVLFIDIVGYSRLSVNEQHARIGELNEVVRLSEQFRKAEAVTARKSHEWTPISAIRLNSFIRVYSRAFAVKIFGCGGTAPRHLRLKQLWRPCQFPGSMLLAC